MDEKIIEKVKDYDVLYNHELIDYKVQFKRQAAWEHIASELNMQAHAVKAKWEKLRRCFINARNRRLQKSSDAKKMPPWRYEREMEFLLPHVESRKIQSNFKDSLSSLGDDSYNIEEIEEFDIMKTEKHSENADSQDSLSECQKYVNNVTKKQLKTEMIDLTTSANFSMGKRKYEEVEDYDETDMFFLSMSIMTKKLPKFEQAKIKLALSNAVLEAEMRYNQILD
ncbi:hypothetical protein JTB14_015628 [Gonioctena quinquepunctata]|nr:hypothetical protein JTB14_015628 [Gonioctena quinquepunctata]